MDNQPKVLPQTASTFFFDGSAMREPVPGTVAIDGLKEDAAFFTGQGSGRAVRRDDPGDRWTRRCSSAATSATRSTASRATTLGERARGFCSSEATSRPRTFHQEKILKYTDGQIFDVITNGQGLMPGYRWPIPPADRWAIIAYVRELQRERLASAASAPQQATASAAAETSEGGTVTNGVMNGALNRKLLFVLGPVAGVADVRRGRVDRHAPDEPRVQGSVPRACRDR